MIKQPHFFMVPVINTGCAHDPFIYSVNFVHYWFVNNRNMYNVHSTHPFNSNSEKFFLVRFVCGRCLYVHNNSICCVFCVRQIPYSNSMMTMISVVVTDILNLSNGKNQPVKYYYYYFCVCIDYHHHNSCAFSFDTKCIWNRSSHSVKYGCILGVEPESASS